MTPRLVGDVIERDSDLAPPLPPTAPGLSAPSPLADRRTGFPSSDQLPSTSCFAATSTAPAVDLSAPHDSLPALLSSISAANDGVLAGMTEREILEEQRQIRESMGLSAGVLRMLEERGRKKVEQQAPVARAVRPPTTEPVKVVKPAVAEDEEEGSPEYIRRHFFPNEPQNHNLDWMRDNSTEASSSTATSTRTFDLQGALLLTTSSLPQATTSSHHVSSSTSFTTASLLSLTSSSVPSQRSTSFLVLNRILTNPSHEDVLGKPDWTALQHAATLHATHALRDPNLLVTSTALSLLAHLLSSEPPPPPPSTTPGVEVPPTLLETLLSADPYPALSLLLSSPLSPSSTSSILSITGSILALALPPSLALEELLASALLPLLAKTTLFLPYPPTSPSPSLQTLSLLISLARSSRPHAQVLLDKNLVDPAMRFLSILPWELDAEQRELGYALVEGTLEYWAVLGRYGLGTSLRTKGASLVEGIVARCEAVFRGVEEGREELGVVEKWIELMGVWMVAAVDPHVTGHDILWTQVEEWRDLALEAAEWSLGREEGGVLRRAWELLGEWVEGSKVNKPWKGEAERTWIGKKMGSEWAEGGRAVERVRTALETLVEGSGEAELEAGIALAASRLSNAYEEDSNPPTSALFAIDSALVEATFAALLPRSDLSWSAIRLLVALLPRIESLPSRLSATLDVLQLLGPGDEVSARDLANWVFTTVASPSSHPFPSISALSPTLELPSLTNVVILRPFLTYAIVTASGGRVVGPLHPSPRDIRLTASQRPFASTTTLLAPDWPLLALNELLRSGTSPVFQQLPPGWDATELDIVRSSLALMRFVAATPVVRTTIAGPLLVYDLIKVFMLEKDNTTSGKAGAESDLFREEGITKSLAELLAPLAIGSQVEQVRRDDTRVAGETIEGVSALVSSAPLYRLYTDLVGLYDSISMSHPSFAQVLLPPLAMAYPIDYRKLLWIDYAHLLRTIKISVEEAITDAPGSGALATYLYPTERNDSLLGAYGDALVSRKTPDEPDSFLSFVAVHHVAASLFGEEQPTLMERRLAGAVVGQGSRELVERLLRYEQGGEGEKLRLPPSCFGGAGGMEGRKERLRSLLDAVGVQKLEVMLAE